MRVNFDEKGENIIGPAIFTDLSILGKYWGIMENGGGRGGRRGRSPRLQGGEREG